MHGTTAVWDVSPAVGERTAPTAPSVSAFSAEGSR